MALLSYTVICSLDGYTNDEQGNFDWAAPDAQLHAFVNDLERPVGTYLYGTRLYQTMRFWEDAHLRADATPEVLDYAAVWQAADKIVYSSTLRQVTTQRTTLEPVFDPEAVRSLLAQADRPVSVGGATLAASALRAGLVGEFSRFEVPVVVGGGTPAWPAGFDARLTLLDEQAFDSGVRYTRYRIE